MSEAVHWYRVERHGDSGLSVGPGFSSRELAEATGAGRSGYLGVISSEWLKGSMSMGDELSAQTAKVLGGVLREKQARLLTISGEMGRLQNEMASATAARERLIEEIGELQRALAINRFRTVAIV